MATRPVVNRPFASLGIGWILAVIAVILVVLMLIHAVAASETLILVSILLTALALLL